MSDFSLFALFTAGLACVAPFANAYTQPSGAEPVGNPIYKPITGDIVPVGQPWNITWGPTTEGTVTLVLLKGPSTNVVPQYPIVERIANSGSYLWTPSTDLEPTENATGYGIQLIVDSSGQYQYSTQFGISNPEYGCSSASDSCELGRSTSNAGPVPYDTTVPSGATVPLSTGITPAATNVTTAPTWYGTGATYPPGTAFSAAPSGYLPGNGTRVLPTGGMTHQPSSTTHAATASSSSSSSATSTSAAATTPAIVPNSAHGLGTSFVGLVMAAGVAVFSL